jgi:hypothetical protein
VRFDRNGKPVVDLTPRFHGLENGKPQKIDYSRRTGSSRLSPTLPSVSAELRCFESSVPQNRHLFLIARTRQTRSVEGVDATLRFVHQRLLPQDQVAVMAWNRATDFTTDHQKAAEVIERFKRDHEAIEALMVQHFSGLGGVHGGSEIPQPLQIMIDRVFGGAQGGA